MIDYAVISNNNILNYWLSLCSKCRCPPFALTHAWRRVRHCLTAVSITRWSSSSQAGPSGQDTRTQFVDVLHPPFSDIACSIISRLVVRIFMLKNSIVTKFCRVSLGGPVIMPHRVYYTHAVLVIGVQPLASHASIVCRMIRIISVANVLVLVNLDQLRIMTLLLVSWSDKVSSPMLHKNYADKTRKHS